MPPAADATRDGLNARPAAVGKARPPADAGWTTSREGALECARCGTAFVLRYKYRFAEGLEAARVRCPVAGCRRPREYYLPVNAFDVAVALVPGPSPRGR